MKNVIVTLFFFCFVFKSSSQDLKPMYDALNHDDTAALSRLFTPDMLTACYGNEDPTKSHYSLLSQAVRLKAFKCFLFILDKGADVNKICNGYVPPLMHAIEYGMLDMVKELIKRGAKTDVSVELNVMEDGKVVKKNQTALSYAIRYKYRNPDIEPYLRSLGVQ